ncbi:MAG: lipopolysaccharide assembly protein LapA domain-containing protein [Bacteroidales bacterium]|nr:lipopolysaccharide assembly protein LapA domain-containing protein [Bacteroidales bacterium]
MKTSIKKIILLLLLAVALIFSAQNFETVNIKFIVWSINLPIAVTLMGIYVLGALTGGLLFSMLKKVVELDRQSKPKEKSSDKKEVSSGDKNDKTDIDQTKSYS